MSTPHTARCSPRPCAAEACFSGGWGGAAALQRPACDGRPAPMGSGALRGRVRFACSALPCGPCGGTSLARTAVDCNPRRALRPTFRRNQVHGDPLDTFTYVPAHIYFVASELIKNACAATVRFHTRADGGSSGGGTHGQGGLPPVKVIVVCGEHDVAIKVADKGGGIPRSKLADVWSYRGAKLSSGQCAAVPVGSDLIRAPEAPAGLGLAISRLHCKFFGGTLHLTPMEG
eukprot:scaffold1625_cov104-Isochrysis_galbana.AAC.6